MRLRVILLAVLAWPTLVLPACGDEPAPPPSRVPADPDEALAWVQDAFAQEETDALDERLAEWPVDATAFETHKATQIVLSWRIRRALDRDDVDAAHRDYLLLKKRFEGTGRLIENDVRIPARIMTVGLFEGVLESARKRVEGANPNLESANEALALANALLVDVPDENRASLEAAQRWVLLRRIKDAHLGVASKGPPQIVLLTDDFALGEAVLPGVLKRWAREGKEYGLEITIIPLWRDFVRVRTRRVPATPQEEGAAINRRAKEMGATVLPTPKSSATHERELGMVPKKNALLVVDRKGVIVARMTGFTIDPRVLEAVVQRVLSR